MRFSLVSFTHSPVYHHLCIPQLLNEGYMSFCFPLRLSDVRSGALQLPWIVCMCSQALAL